MNQEDKGNANFEKYLKHDMLKNPEKYLQPWIKRDSFGRDYCNPDFVKHYGNPHNEVRKNDIYLEKNRDQILQEKEDERIRNSYDETEELLKTHTVNKYTLRPLLDKRYKTKWDHECKVCGMVSTEQSVLCWYCLMRVDFK